MIEFPPFRLDAVNQCLWRRRDSGEDERIPLPPKTFGVLRYLVEHAGRLVTEDELLEAVWPDTVVQPQAVKSQLFDIRRILGDNPKTPAYIETLPKRGYQFIALVREGPSADLAVPKKTAPRPLVGRDRPLGELRDCLARVLRQQRQIVFITGEPGIGKTALVDEFQRQAAAEVPGLRVARGQCVEGYGSKEAYYPMLEALGQLCRASGGEAIIGILAAQAPTSLVQFPALVKPEHRELLQREILGATRERMLREIVGALEIISAQYPLLLVFEDLQWVDHSTVDLLSALTRRRAPAELMLIGTKRPVDMSSPGHPLKALRQDLLVHQLCHEIDLEPLAEADVAHYLAAVSAGASLPKGLAGLIHRHSEGNPLFMVAVLDHLTQRGLISRESASWRLRVPLEEIDLVVPENLRQMIEAQIGRLSMEEQRALEVASVAGSAFSASIAASATDLDSEDFADLCEGLARRHRMLRPAGAQRFPDASISPRYEFVHALYREVFYGRLGAGRRARLHRRMGERLEVLYGEALSEMATELAHHFEQASDWPRAVKYLRLAADAAERRYGHREAEALLEHALVLASKLPGPQGPMSEIGILETLASIYYLSLDGRAPDIYEALASRAAQCGVIDVEVRALIEMAVLWTWADSRRCLELLDRALKLSGHQVDPLAQAKSRFHCSYWRIQAGGWNQDDAAACRATMSELRQACAPPALGPHLMYYSELLFMSSEYRESRRDALEGLAAVLPEGSKGNPCANVPQINAAYALYFDYLFLGEWGEALRQIEASIAALTKNANDVFAQAMRFWQAWLHVQAMDFAGALATCESTARSLGDAIVPPSERFYLAVAGTAEVALGNHERALEHLSLARREMDRQMVVNDWYCRLLIESALTELWLAKGDLAQARSQVERYLNVTQATAEHTWQALAWEANARVSMAEGDLKRTQECIAKALATMEGFEVPLAEWRVHAGAMELYERTGNRELAKQHRTLSCATILKLADSLPADHPLRKTFLSARAVSKVLAGVDPGRLNEGS